MIPYCCHLVIESGSITPLKDKNSKLYGATLSLDTRESVVLCEELGCISCCFGTESAFQHWRKQPLSNTRVDPGRKYGRTSGPKRVLS